MIETEWLCSFIGVFKHILKILEPSFANDHFEYPSLPSQYVAKVNSCLYIIFFLAVFKLGLNVILPPLQIKFNRISFRRILCYIIFFFSTKGPKKYLVLSIFSNAAKICYTRKWMLCNLIF